MDNEKVFNRNVFKAIFVVTGIILFCGGLSDENVLLTFIGLICVVVGFTGKRKPIIQVQKYKAELHRICPRIPQQ